jgi:hypothetical protein
MVGSFTDFVTVPLDVNAENTETALSSLSSKRISSGVDADYDTYNPSNPIRRAWAYRCITVSPSSWVSLTSVASVSTSTVLMRCSVNLVSPRRRRLLNALFAITCVDSAACSRFRISLESVSNLVSMDCERFSMALKV